MKISFKQRYSDMLLTCSISFVLISSDSQVALLTWNLRSTLVFTQLTFCPPGPPLALYVIFILSIGM